MNIPRPIIRNETVSYSELPSVSLSLTRGNLEYVTTKIELSASGHTQQEAREGLKFLLGCVEVLDRKGDEGGE